MSIFANVPRKGEGRGSTWVAARAPAPQCVGDILHRDFSLATMSLNSIRDLQSKLKYQVLVNWGCQICGSCLLWGCKMQVCVRWGEVLGGLGLQQPISCPGSSLNPPMPAPQIELFPMEEDDKDYVKPTLPLSPLWPTYPEITRRRLI